MRRTKQFIQVGGGCPGVGTSMRDVSPVGAGDEDSRETCWHPDGEKALDRSLTLNLTSDLVGVPVCAAGSSQAIGDITDALIEPIEGRLLGLVLRMQNGAERVVPARRLKVGAECISIIRDEEGATWGDDGSAAGVRALRELCGANVVTDEGELLGHVREIQVSPSDGRVAYGIGEMPLLQRIFGRGFVIEGSVARSYSRAGSRLIVRAPDTPCEVGGRLHSAPGPSVGAWWKAEQRLHAYLCRYGFLIWLAILIGVLLVLLWV